MRITLRNIVVACFLLTAKSGFSLDTNCVYLASDVYPGTYGALPSSFAWYNGALHFRATGNGLGPELWKYEGGTSVFVADINPGFPGSLLNELTVVGSNLYFSAIEGTTGQELYKYDGTSVTLVADINPGPTGSGITKLTAVGSELFFTADNGISGMELWKYDGTTATMVHDANPGAGSSNPVEIAAVGTNVYFSANSPATGLELWKYNGSTTSVIDIYPGTTGSDLGELRVLGTKLVFRATDGVNGYELFTHDGSTLVCLNANPTSDFTPWELTVAGTNLFCRGFMASAGGYELWKYDGTTCSLVADINPTANSNPNNITAVGSKIYFAANDGVIGNELWESDGVTTTLVADIRTGASGSMPAPSMEKFGVVGNNVFLIAASGISGNEVWRYDGTNLILADIVIGAGSSSPTTLKGFGDKLYFVADDGSTGGELWIWDTDADLTESITVYTCGNYTSPGGTLYTAEGVYNFVDVIPSTDCPGCDSVITVDLTITAQPSSSQTIFACNDYTSPAGTYYTVEGNYVFTDVLPSVSCPGLDSLINIDLTIVDGISTAVVVFSGVIVSQQPGATYQWLDCDDGYTPIPGATDQDFLPTVSGIYACQVTLGSCTDTTNCNYVESTFGIGFSELIDSEISIFPNPATDIITVSTGSLADVQILIYDNLGNVIFDRISDNQSEEINVNQFADGLYFVHIRSEQGDVVRKLIKH